jgi:hypothetical protein
MIKQELDEFWQQQKEVQLLRQQLYDKREKERSERIDQEISEKNGWIEIGVQHLIM